jgi:RHS repeat-associated protein
MVQSQCRTASGRLNNSTTYTGGLDLSGTLDGAGGIGGLLACTYAKLLHAPGAMPHAYYACDGNGNVTCLMYPNGQVAARYLYDPFGSLLGAVGPLAEANLYRFSSKELHPPSGLVYYGYRFYDPSLQRWVNRDPIAEQGGVNLFGFVDNGPLARVDPDGRSWAKFIPCVACVACAGVAGGSCAVICALGHWDDLDDTFPDCWWKCMEAASGRECAAFSMTCYAACLACGIVSIERPM